jgi:uncharacterized C2H2 Zn-finger protein
MSEHETQFGDDEVGRCHICAQVFDTQEDLSKHLMEAHGGREPATGSK